MLGEQGLLSEEQELLSEVFGKLNERVCRLECVFPRKDEGNLKQYTVERDCAAVTGTQSCGTQDDFDKFLTDIVNYLNGCAVTNTEEQDSGSGASSDSPRGYKFNILSITCGVARLSMHYVSHEKCELNIIGVRPIVQKKNLFTKILHCIVSTLDRCNKKYTHKTRLTVTYCGKNSQAALININTRIESTWPEDQRHVYMVEMAHKEETQENYSESRSPWFQPTDFTDEVEEMVLLHLNQIFAWEYSGDLKRRKGAYARLRNVIIGFGTPNLTLRDFSAFLSLFPEVTMRLVDWENPQTMAEKTFEDNCGIFLVESIGIIERYQVLSNSYASPLDSLPQTLLNIETLMLEFWYFYADVNESQKHPLGKYIDPTVLSPNNENIAKELSDDVEKHLTKFKELLRNGDSIRGTPDGLTCEALRLAQEMFRDPAESEYLEEARTYEKAKKQIASA